MQIGTDHRPSQRLLEVIETEINDYARRQGITNPYWYFGELLNYKSKNALYDWFRETGTKKIGYADLWKVIRITHSKRLINAVIADIKDAVGE